MVPMYGIKVVGARMNRTNSECSLPSKAAQDRRTPRRWRVGHSRSNFRQVLILLSRRDNREIGDHLRGKCESEGKSSEAHPAGKSNGGTAHQAAGVVARTGPPCSHRADSS